MHYFLLNKKQTSFNLKCILNVCTAFFFFLPCKASLIRYRINSPLSCANNNFYADPSSETEGATSSGQYLGVPASSSGIDQKSALTKPGDLLSSSITKPDNSCQYCDSNDECRRDWQSIRQGMFLQYPTTKATKKINSLR